MNFENISIVCGFRKVLEFAITPSKWHFLAYNYTTLFMAKVLVIIPL